MAPREIWVFARNGSHSEWKRSQRSVKSDSFEKSLIESGFDPVPIGRWGVEGYMTATGYPAKAPEAHNAFLVVILDAIKRAWYIEIRDLPSLLAFVRDELKPFCDLTVSAADWDSLNPVETKAPVRVLECVKPK